VLARRPIAWGPTREVLTPPVLARALRLSEAWDEAAAICRHEGHHEGHHEAHHEAPTPGIAAADPHDHGHDHAHHDHQGHGHTHARHGAVS
jgi:zinc/manganese transport system ATP-binding protein